MKLFKSFLNWLTGLFRAETRPKPEKKAEIPTETQIKPVEKPKSFQPDPAFRGFRLKRNERRLLARFFEMKPDRIYNPWLKVYNNSPEDFNRLYYLLKLMKQGGHFDLMLVAAREIVDILIRSKITKKKHLLSRTNIHHKKRHEIKWNFKQDLQATKKQYGDIFFIKPRRVKHEFRGATAH